MDVTPVPPSASPRVSLLRPLLLALAACAAMPNGLFFSPLFDSVLFILPRASGAFFLTGETSTFYMSGMLLWLVTLGLAGIPAALYERFFTRRQPSVVSLLIWIAAAAALSIPSIRAAIELLTDPL